MSRFVGPRMMCRWDEPGDDIVRLRSHGCEVLSVGIIRYVNDVENSMLLK